MKRKNMKIISVLLTVCMLPLPNMAAYADASGLLGVGADLVQNISDYKELKATGSDALKEEELIDDEANKELVTESIYDTDLVLTEEEIKHGVPLPSGEGDELDESAFDSFDFFNKNLDIEALIRGEAVYAEETPRKPVSSADLDVEKRIDPVYDQQTREKLRGLIMGGSDRVKYIADQMTFGITPIYLDTSGAVGWAFNEANWQNQMILEEDFLTVHPDPAIYEDESGKTYYRYDVEYEISDPALRKKYQLEMYDKAQKIIDEVGMYTEGKYVEELFEINNYIIDHAVYDHEVADKDISKTMSSKAYGVLINGKGICTSYARAFQLVARMAGFICVVDGGHAAISRDNSTGEIKTGAHAWNMVCIQGNE